MQVAPNSSADVPDEAGGVRAVVLGGAFAHNGRDNSDAMTEAKGIFAQRGTTPRIYRNMLIFLAAESRQLDGLKEAMRSSLAWATIVRETERLNLTQKDSALAKAKASEAAETVKTRLKEAWCYLIYPLQDSAQSDVEWTTAKIAAQDGILSRASKKLVSDEGLFQELGPARLDRVLQKYIWNGKDHLSLRDLWEYLNRYTYMPRLKDQKVLIGTVRSAVTGMIPGPFAYAERWDDQSQAYVGLAIQNASNATVVVDSDSVIVMPNVAEAQRLKEVARAQERTNIRPPDDDEKPKDGGAPPPMGEPGGVPPQATPPSTPEPTHFIGTVMIDADRPAHEMRQIVEAIVEQLTTMPGSQVALKLEIDAEVPNGLDRGKVRTLLENANTLGFIDKLVK